MNLISWATTPTIIRENTINYIYDNAIIEESIAKTLKPVMNKMKKLNIGLPYRDARLFFFKFLQDKYPNLVPPGFETRKPSAKDVNAIVGTIAMEQPDVLDSISTKFEAYSKETVPGGLDRVSQFLNIAATLRQGKGVRPKKAEGYIVKDYSQLTAQEISNATTEAIARKKKETGVDDDVSDEKLLLRTAAGVVIAKLRDEDISEEALDNVADAVGRINSLNQFEKFLDYIVDMEEYSTIYQYLVDIVDIVKDNLQGITGEAEDEEGNIYDDVRYDPRETNDMYNEFDDEEPLDELSILTPEQFERAVETVPGFNPSEWGFSKIQNIYFKIRKGGEDEESSTSRYMPASLQQPRQEEEEIKMSQTEINRLLATRERQRVQHLYAQQRRHMHGY